MLINWMLRQDKQIPRRLLVAITALLVVVMTCALVFFGYNLFLRVASEQTALMRQHYGFIRENTARIEFFSTRIRRIVALPPEVFPPPEALTRQIKEALENSSPGTIVTLDFSPLTRPVSVLVNRPLREPQSSEVSLFMARAALFDREYWESGSALGGRTDLMLADNSAGLIVPATSLPDRESVLKLFQFWGEMINDKYQQRITQVGSETVWSQAYKDRFSGGQVISYAVPARNEQGHLIAVLTYTLPGYQLMGDIPGGDEKIIETAHQMILFDYSGKLWYQGVNTLGYDLDGLYGRVADELSRSDAGTTFWFEQSSLMFAGVTTPYGWRTLHIYPLTQALRDFHWQISGAIGLYFLGLLLIYYGVQQIRRHVLTPLQQSAEQIEHSERFNRTMLQIAPVGLRMVRIADERLEIENELARKILPFHSQHEGRPWIKSLPVDRPARLQLQVRNQIGEINDILIISEPVDYQGDAVLLCAISDMTEELRIRRTLQQAHREADEASRMKSLFLAAMSHEIRTPLYGVIGTLELLSLGELNSAQRQKLDTIQFSSRVLLQVLNDLLDYSKVEAGRVNVDAIPFDPIDLIETAVRAQSPIARHKTLRLACYLQPDLPGLVGDPVRIRQVLDNLLSNALKFTEQGKITVRMWQETHETDPKKINMHIEVADTGIGIAPEMQKRLFEPFYQGELAMTQRYGGTGLGLAICRAYLALMNGDISLSSQPGEGSRFHVTIELERDHPRAQGNYKLPPVAVLSDDTDWQRNLIDIVMWSGGRAVSCPGDAPELGMVLLAATPQNMPMPKGYMGVVKLLPDGPLQPERHLDAHEVNTYSQNGILQAICMAGGQNLANVEEMDNGGQEFPQLGLNVLVVEDHPYNRQLIQQQLEQLGCRVQVAGDGEEALLAIGQDTFDVLLTDVQMPVMDGYELTRRLRAQGNTIPIVGLTASITPEDTQHCLEAGMLSMLGKPILLAALVEGLKTALPERIAQLQQAIQKAANAPSFNIKTEKLLAQTLKEDIEQLFAAFERSDLLRVKQLAHRMRGAAVHVEGGEEIAELCSELENDLNTTLDEIRHRVDDLSLYVKAFLNERSA